MFVRTLLSAPHWGLAALLSAALPVWAVSPADYQQWRLPDSAPHPADNLPSPARIELGKMLFYDQHLSGDGKSSCASCHIAELGWSDGKATPSGIGGKPMARNSMSLTNVGFYTGPYMWAGQKTTLEAQAAAPLNHPNIMATDVAALVKYLKDEPTYATRFAKAYPGEPVDLGTVTKAIANFERSIVSRDTAFDRWLAGDTRAMTPQQLRGLDLFTRSDRANCASCHSAPNFSDNGFYNIGLPSKDIGRYGQVPLPIMQGAFKVPQLRDVEYKTPYMHDGSLKTLEEVVAHYNAGGRNGGAGPISEGIAPLSLSQREKDDLVAFLKALSGPRPRTVLPTLP